MTIPSDDAVLLACMSSGLRESEVDLSGKKEVKDVSVSASFEHL